LCTVEWEQVARATLHPLQLRIIERAAAGGRFSPKQLADEWGLPVNNLAYHVRALRDLKLLTPAGTKQRRGATEHYYRGSRGLFG
jgi:predicted transcriptional regulator